MAQTEQRGAADACRHPRKPRLSRPLDTAASAPAVAARGGSAAGLCPHPPIHTLQPHEGAAPRRFETVVMERGHV